MKTREREKRDRGFLLLRLRLFRSQSKSSIGGGVGGQTPFRTAKEGGGRKGAITTSFAHLQDIGTHQEHI